MNINMIVPQGYCSGVERALRIVDECLLNKTLKRPIYLLGNIIHNKNVVDDFRKKGAIIIEEKGKTRLELMSLINSGTVVFSAHGVSPKVYNLARVKGIDVIDATCGYVLSVQNKIRQMLNNSYEVIYIGTKGHPECEGVLGLSDKIHFITSILDIDRLNIDSNKIFVTNQTTLSEFDLTEMFIKLKEKYKNISIDDKICNATTVRQKALAFQPKADLCIIVGDKESSNTLKLAKVSETIAHVPTLLVEGVSDLLPFDFSNIRTVNISSGASTPAYITNQIASYLKKL